MTTDAWRPDARPESLWLLVAAPALWLAHFLACYVTAALACGRWGSGAGASGSAAAIAVYTVGALSGMGVCLRMSLRARREAPPMTALDDDTPESRRHFLAAAAILLTLLTVVATLFVAAATVLVPRCA